MLTEQEIKNIKQQIIKQIQAWNTSEEQKSQAKEEVEAMNSEELEEFLKKNSLVKEQGKQECPFCLILQNKIPAYRIDENKSSLAVLEINPLSLGHTIVISKNHKKLPSSAFTLANKIAKKIKSKLKPEEVKIENVSIQGHKIVAIIPIYAGKKLEKRKAEEKELILLQDKLKSKPKIKKQRKIVSEVKENLPVVKKRIP